jgi:MFS family permease
MILTVAGAALASAATAATPGAGYLVGVRALGGLGLSEQAVNATYLNEIYAATEDEKIKKRGGLIYSLVRGGWPLGVLMAAAFVAIFLPIVGWRGCFLIAVFPHRHRAGPPWAEGAPTVRARARDAEAA